MSQIKGVIDLFNAQLKSLNENKLKVYDADNPEYFIIEVEYKADEDKIIFKTAVDPEEYKRMMSK